MLRYREKEEAELRFSKAPLNIENNLILGTKNNLKKMKKLNRLFGEKKQRKASFFRS